MLAHGANGVNTPKVAKHACYLWYISCESCTMSHQVSEQAKLTQELDQVKETVIDQQEILADRLQQVQAKHRNLEERLKYLTLLHWNAPRPLTQAEKELGRQLDVSQCCNRVGVVHHAALSTEDAVCAVCDCLRLLKMWYSLYGLQRYRM